MIEISATIDDVPEDLRSHLAEEDRMTLVREALKSVADPLGRALDRETRIRGLRLSETFTLPASVLVTDEAD